MGRSKASCFKIIACGGDSVDKDDAGASEGKGSSDKRGWSFRKKSSAHRVLSNTVISEFPSSVKEQPETANVKLQTQLGTTSVETENVKLQTQPDPIITGKSPVIPWTEEKAQSFDPVISTTPDTKYTEEDDAEHTAPDAKYAKEDDIVHTTPDTKYDKEDDKVHKVIPDESVIRIQAAIRKYLAQRETVKLKNVIKLQAAVRGHLVRRHAVGTLRCVQAIVKMQALVRARRVCVSSEGSLAKEKQERNLGSNFSENGNHATKPNISIEKLLSNKFAHQLLETAPKTKRIHVKCDPSKLDSAWIWLERWMSASSVKNEQPRELESVVEPQGLDKVEGSLSQSESVSPSEGFKANNGGEVVPSKSEENVIACDVDNFDFLPSQPIPSSKSYNQELPNTDNSLLSDSRTGSLDLLANQIEISDVISQEEVKTGSSKAEMESELSSGSVKVPEQVETEENKVSIGTRKATNPAFIAAQSKFKELSSTGNSTRSTSSFSQDVGVEVSSDAVSTVLENGKRARDVDESSVQNNSRAKFGGSECGTELSISSTLDSPDRRETGEMDDQEVTSNPNSYKNVAETNGEINIGDPNLSYSIEVQSEKVDAVGDANVEHINLVPVNSSLEVQKLDVNEADVQNNLEDTVHQMHKSTPEASPRSHMTALEFQETPSSQVSVRAERTKSGDRGSSKQKRKSLSASHKSPSNSKHDSSSVRSSLEQLPKENKSGKRRNSFGSVKPDYVDQEPRDSNSSSTLPSYMQATESARAKALPNSSPRSSPDVTKDVQIKKRHSLPGANGRQGSPQIQRSASQTKGSSQPQERKWQR